MSPCRGFSLTSLGLCRLSTCSHRANWLQSSRSRACLQRGRASGGSQQLILNAPEKTLLLSLKETGTADGYAGANSPTLGSVHAPVSAPEIQPESTTELQPQPQSQPEPAPEPKPQLKPEPEPGPEPDSVFDADTVPTPLPHALRHVQSALAGGRSDLQSSQKNRDGLTGAEAEAAELREWNAALAAELATARANLASSTAESASSHRIAERAATAVARSERAALETQLDFAEKAYRCLELELTEEKARATERISRAHHEVLQRLSGRLSAARQSQETMAEREVQLCGLVAVLREVDHLNEAVSTTTNYTELVRLGHCRDAKRREADRFIREINSQAKHAQVSKEGQPNVQPETNVDLLRAEHTAAAVEEAVAALRKQLDDVTEQLVAVKAQLIKQRGLTEHALAEQNAAHHRAMASEAQRAATALELVRFTVCLSFCDFWQLLFHTTLLLLQNRTQSENRHLRQRLELAFIEAAAQGVQLHAPTNPAAPRNKRSTGDRRMAIVHQKKGSILPRAFSLESVTENFKHKGRARNHKTRASPARPPPVSAEPGAPNFVGMKTLPAASAHMDNDRFNTSFQQTRDAKGTDINDGSDVSEGSVESGLSALLGSGWRCCFGDATLDGTNRRSDAFETQALDSDQDAGAADKPFDLPQWSDVRHGGQRPQSTGSPKALPGAPPLPTGPCP
eukprot:SAG31_NODE_3108_length_4666_cov_2.823336_1_plen_684_part_00